MNTIIVAIVAMIFWALWLVMSDVSAQEYTPGQMYLYITCVNLVFSGLYVLIGDQGSVIPEDTTDIHLLIITGLFSSFGSVLFYIAVEQSGEYTAVVYTITSLYFVLSVFIGWFFFGDIMKPKDWVGLVLAVGAVILISI